MRAVVKAGAGGGGEGGDQINKTVQGPGLECFFLKVSRYIFHCPTKKLEDAGKEEVVMSESQSWG